MRIPFRRSGDLDLHAAARTLQYLGRDLRARHLAGRERRGLSVHGIDQVQSRQASHEFLRHRMFIALLGVLGQPPARFALGKPDAILIPLGRTGFARIAVSRKVPRNHGQHQPALRETVFPAVPGLDLRERGEPLLLGRQLLPRLQPSFQRGEDAVGVIGVDGCQERAARRADVNPLSGLARAAAVVTVLGHSLKEDALRIGPLL